MGRVEEAPQTGPTFEIVRMTVRKGREILVTVDLGKEDPDLTTSAPRNLRAELDGILHCGKWNKDKEEAIVGGRFNFKTGQIMEAALTEDEQADSPIKEPDQRFVLRATTPSDKNRRKLTRMPERHSKNYPVVTGDNPAQFTHTLRVSGTRYHVREILSDGKTRPIIPAGIRKAPTVEPREDLMTYDQTVKPNLNDNGSSILHTNIVTPRDGFKIQEIATFGVVRPKKTF